MCIVIFLMCKMKRCNFELRISEYNAKIMKLTLTFDFRKVFLSNYYSRNFLTSSVLREYAKNVEIVKKFKCILLEMC